MNLAPTVDDQSYATPRWSEQEQAVLQLTYVWGADEVLYDLYHWHKDGHVENYNASDLW